MLFNILFIADWKKIGEHRQWLTDLNTNTAHENEGRIDYDYKVGQKVLVWNDGVLCKAESRYLNDPWKLVVILAGAVCNIYIFIWYISTVS
jgi:hypothetical protein